MTLKKWISLILTLSTLQVFGQLIVTPIGHGARQSIANPFAKKLAVGDTLTLPFWDDFSKSSIVPDTTFWVTGKDVYINPTQGLNPPTLNVATFDGSTGDGYPYNTTATTPQVNDILESRPINLEGYSESDSVVITFYWQREGLGNQPNGDDKFSLLFKTKESLYDTAWYMYGIDTLNLDSSFQEVRVKLTNDYLHDGFQFRFQSYGSSGGAFDSWHLDYVYINRDRPSVGQESLVDHAVSKSPSSIFKPYTTVPRSQLLAYADTLYSDIFFTLSNFENATQTVEYTYSLYQVDTASGAWNPLYTLPPTGGNPLVGIGQQKDYSIPALSSAIFDPNEGNMELISELTFLTRDEYFISTKNGANITYLIDDQYNYRLNDTARVAFSINETLAYDDGTAEKSAGVKAETGGAKIAVYYQLATEDTLTHVDISFPSVKDLPDNPRFKLYIAKDLSDEPSSILASQEFTVIDTLVGIDQFGSYEFTKPAILSGGFHVIFEQFTNNRFPIGLDVNTQNGDKMHLNFGSAWEQNNILDVNGSLMIRPRFADSDYVVAGVQEPTLSSTSVYPNPANQTLHIQGRFDRFELYNLSGRKVLEGNAPEASVGQLPNGLYILKVFEDQMTTSHKVVIRH